MCNALFIQNDTFQSSDATTPKRAKYLHSNCTAKILGNGKVSFKITINVQKKKQKWISQDILWWFNGRWHSCSLEARGKVDEGINFFTKLTVIRRENSPDGEIQSSQSQRTIYRDCSQNIYQTSSIKSNVWRKISQSVSYLMGAIIACRKF